MVALVAGYQATALGLADFNEVLPSKLHGSFRCLGTSRDKVNPIKRAWGVKNQQIRQFFGGFRGKESCMGEGTEPEPAIESLRLCQDHHDQDRRPRLHLNHPDRLSRFRRRDSILPPLTALGGKRL